MRLEGIKKLVLRSALSQGRESTICACAICSCSVILSVFDASLFDMDVHVELALVS